jgi:hypothetical protein
MLLWRRETGAAKKAPVSIIRWLATCVAGRAGRHGTGPVEAEKDPGEQGVQAEAPAGARPTRQLRILRCVHYIRRDQESVSN